MCRLFRILDVLQSKKMTTEEVAGSIGGWIPDHHSKRQKAVHETKKNFIKSDLFLNVTEK